MNIAIPINKILFIITSLIISTIIVNSFLTDNQEIKNTVPEISSIEIKKTLIKILNESYKTKEESYIKILNINRNIIFISNFKLFNFYIKINNEIISWNIRFLKIQFNKNNNFNYSINYFYSINENPIKEIEKFKNNWILIPTLHLYYEKINQTDKVYHNLFITHLTSNKEIKIQNELEIKFYFEKYKEKIVRVANSNGKVSLILNGYEIFSFNVIKGDAILFNISKILLDALIVKK